MEPMDTETSNEIIHRQFVSFLYSGQICQKYVAGWCRDDGNNFECHETFKELVKNSEDADRVVEALLKYEKLTSFSSPVIYALAVVIKWLPRDDESLSIRKKFYDIIPIVLDTQEKLMLFNVFITKLKIQKGTVWQRCLQSWYAACDFEKLLLNLPLKSRHGWNHRIIFNLLHLPKVNDAHQALSKYIYEGVDSVLKLECISNDLKSKMASIKKLRECKDVPSAHAIVHKNNFMKIGHLPSSLRSSCEIWKLLVPRMCITDVMNGLMKLQRESNINDYYHNQVVDAHLITVVKNYISTLTCSPLTAYLLHCDYEAHIKCMSKNKLLKNYQFENILGEPLLSLVDRSLQEIKMEIDGTCFIALDLRSYMFTSSRYVKTKVKPAAKDNNESSKNKKSEKTAVEKNTESIKNIEVENLTSCKSNAATEKSDAEDQCTDAKLRKKNLVTKTAKCFSNKNVVPAHAGILLALYMSKYAKTTIVGVYQDLNMATTSLFDSSNKLLSFAEAEKKLKSLDPGIYNRGSPFKWASEQKENIDLFIHVTTHINCNESSIPIDMALKLYEKEIKKTGSKSVNISLCSSDISQPPSVGDVTMDIAGFDEHLPSVIRNFYSLPISKVNNS